MNIVINVDRAGFSKPLAVAGIYGRGNMEHPKGGRALVIPISNDIGIRSESCMNYY